VRPKKKPALEQYEDILGGRDGVIDLLSLSALDKKEQHFLRLLCDPIRKDDSINTIAREAGIPPQQIMDLFRSAPFAKAHMLAQAKMAEALPAVADDIASKSVDMEVECPACRGEAAPGFFCPQCQGRGTIMRPSDLDRQKLLLESTGMLKKSGGIQVNQNVNTNVGIMNPAGFFSKAIKASDDAAYTVTATKVEDE
jgi:hypothetical protein